MEKLASESVAVILLFIPRQLWGDIASVCRNWYTSVSKGINAIYKAVPWKFKSDEYLKIYGRILMGWCIKPESFKKYYTITPESRRHMVASKDHLEYTILRMELPIVIRSAKWDSNIHNEHYLLTKTNDPDIFHVDEFYYITYSGQHTLVLSRQYIKVYFDRFHKIGSYVCYEINRSKPQNLMTVDLKFADEMAKSGNIIATAEFYPNGQIKSAANGSYKFHWLSTGELEGNPSREAVLIRDIHSCSLNIIKNIRHLII